MGKIYAKQLDCEFFNYEAYYSEYEAESDLFGTYGNKDYKDLNNYRDEYKKKLEDCKFDLDTTRDDAEVYLDLDAELTKIVKYYFQAKENKKELSSKDIDTLISLCDEFDTCRFDAENNIICAALEICYGFKFKIGRIHGCCQGDWLNYICPADLDDNYIEYIEAVLFATGSEFMITDCECESREEAEKAFDNGDCNSVYTAKWITDEVKEDLAKQCYGNCKAEDIVLLIIKDRHAYVEYDYTEE